MTREKIYDYFSNLIQNEEDAQAATSFVLENFEAKDKRTSTVSSWIDEWLELFPKGVKSGSKLLRSDRPGCLNKMVKFVKLHKYPKETIMQATKNYLNERAAEGYKFTKCAVYFIDKMNEGSELAARCAEFEDTGKTVKEEIPYVMDDGLI